MWDDPVIKRLGKDYFAQVDDPETRIKSYDDKYRGVEGVSYGQFEEGWEFVIPSRA